MVRLGMPMMRLLDKNCQFTLHCLGGLRTWASGSIFFSPKELVFPNQVNHLLKPLVPITEKGSVLITTMANVNGPIHVGTGMSALSVQERTQSLNVLKKCLPPSSRDRSQRAYTPVKWRNMLPWLRVFPDRSRARLLLEGFRDGFLLPPFSGTGCHLVNNLKSISQFPDIVSDKIATEILEGRVSGPFNSPPFPNFRVSPLGIVPKKEKNSFRLIHHLSFPKGQSLNDQIDDRLSSVCYASFEDALVKLRSLGKGTLMAKADIKSAFRLLPVHPNCFNSLGFFFNNQFYFDKCLPMGCSLSCFYFESFSSFLDWVVSIEANSNYLLHYLDDFLFLGQAGSLGCSFFIGNFFQGMLSIWHSSRYGENSMALYLY